MTPAQLFSWLNYQPVVKPGEPDEPTDDLAALIARVAALEAWAEKVERMSFPLL